MTDGSTLIINAKRDDVVKVEVKKTTGEWKKVSEVKVTEPATHARITSPKVKVAAEMKLHEGPVQTAKTDKPTPQAVGAVTATRSQAGNPVLAVALECPNPENLKLGPNAKYRDVIIAAGKRSGFTPQSIAAIMNAEAATITHWAEIAILDKKTRKPAFDKDGRPKVKKIAKNDGEWDPRSASDKSSARGMTQFLDGSWIDMALAEGTFLNHRLKNEGWLTTTKITAKQGKKSVEKEVPAFKRADSGFITKIKNRSLVQVLSSRPHITGRGVASDGNLQKLLDLRYSPEYAINTAVDYGLQNLKGLKDDNFKLDGLSDGDKAKLIYLTHHLGLADAKRFIKNSMNAADAERLLVAQIGTVRAAVFAEQNGNDYVKGHRTWLLTFVDKKIDLPAKMCDSSKAAAVRPLLDITLAIRQ